MAGMTIHRLGRGLYVAAVVAALTTPGLTSRLSAQSATGFRASWGDLENWTRLNSQTKQNEVGLGLQVSGKGGLMFVAFTTQFDVRSPSTPREVVVTVGLPINSNPNAIRPPTLSFQVENEKREKKVLDLTSTLQVDNPGFRAKIESGVARLRADEFLLVAKAETVSGEILGVSVDFRKDQIKAIKTYAEKIGLKTTDAK